MSSIELALLDPDGIGGFYVKKFLSSIAKKQDKLIAQGTGYIDKSEALVNKIYDSLLDFIEMNVSGALTDRIDAIYKSMGINQSSMELVKQVTNSTTGLITKVLSFINIMPRSLNETPGINGALMEIAVSYKDIIMEQINSLKLVYDETINAAINSTATILQLIQGSQEVIISTIEDLFDGYVYQYTGYHIIELYYKLLPGISLARQYFKSINAYKKLSKEDKKKLKDKRKKQAIKKIKNKSKAVYEDGKEIVTDTANEIKDEAIQEAKDDVYERTGVNVDSAIDAIGSTTQMSVVVDPQELYSRLYTWLQRQSDALYNAFMMIMMKEFIGLIKEDILKLTNISIESLAENIDSFDDLIKLLDELGLNDDTPTISLELIVTTGLNSIFAISNSIKTLTKEIDIPKLSELGGVVLGSLDVEKTSQRAYEITSDFKDNQNYINILLHANPNNKVVKGLLMLLLKRIKFNKKRVFNNGQVNTILDNMYAIFSHYMVEHEKDSEDDKKNNLVFITNQLLLGHKKFSNDLYKESDFINGNSFIITAIIDNLPVPYIFKIEVSDVLDIVSGNVGVKNIDKNKASEDAKSLYNKFALEKTTDKKGNKDNTVNMIIKNFIGNTVEELKWTKALKQRNTFDITKLILLAFKPLSKLLKEIAKLVENYKTNKRTVLTHARADLKLSFLNVMEKLGLRKKKLIGDNNVYTVRTLKLYKFCISTLGLTLIGLDGFSEITPSQTNILIDYLNKNKLLTNKLLPDRGTILYFDIDNINSENSIAKDGTTNGIDKIEIIPDDGIILYSENNRSTTSSLILRAMRQKIPFK